MKLTAEMGARLGRTIDRVGHVRGQSVRAGQTRDCASFKNDGVRDRAG